MQNNSTESFFTTSSLAVAMRVFRALILFCSIQVVAAAADLGPIRISEAQQKFCAELAKEFRGLENSNTRALAQADGWLFLASELRLLSVGKFWGNEANGIAPARKPEQADPAAAIVDFSNQLRQRGIGLLLVPVPPKAAVYPDKVLPQYDLHGESAAPFLNRFYDELRSDGVDVLDLAPLFSARRAGKRGPVFCKTDTHWSGAGCVLAAQAMAEKVRSKMSPPSRHDYVSDWKQIEFSGDLGSLLPRDAPKPGPEKTFIRAINDKSSAAFVQPDMDSPLLLLGDSYTLVYHDFLAQGAGLVDQLANELGFAPDLIGTRGSGATAVRVGLYRRSHKDPGYLAKKKMIIWCFAAREFTEADAWELIPVSK